MLYDNKIWLGTSDEGPVFLLPQMANRHGLISGATGTGKTVTLQVLAEGFSRMGVPVFLADVKGDLTGVSHPGEMNSGIVKRLNKCGVRQFDMTGSPVTLWDVYGEKGHPVRTTVTEMGPLLLSRLLSLNDTQSGVMHLIFRIADDYGLPLIDLKDLKAMLAYIGEDPSRYTLDYGNITRTSLGAIQRALAVLEEEGGNDFFGEPALEISDWLCLDAQGQGMINILNAEKLFQNPTMYSTFLLWMLAELYNLLPEQGDSDKPRMVFFFDEAHLLFEDCGKALMDKIVQTVRLIRSKGVGVYFITQNPADVPSAVLSQLAGRVQHALRAFTPQELKVVHTVAQTFRTNPAFDTEEAITNLKTGEALISFLMEDGSPAVVQKATILPPQSLIGIISDEQRAELESRDLIGSKYDVCFDRESAYELLAARLQGAEDEEEEEEIWEEENEPGFASEPQGYSWQPSPIAAQPVQPVAFRVYNPATGQYEEQYLAQMPTQQLSSQPAAPTPVQAWTQPVPGSARAAVPTIKKAKPLAPAPRKEEKTETKAASRQTKQNQSLGGQLLTSFVKSATTASGRTLGTNLSRSLLGVLGLDGKKKTTKKSTTTRKKR